MPYIEYRIAYKLIKTSLGVCMQPLMSRFMIAEGRRL